MKEFKLSAGDTFPDLTVSSLNDGEIVLGKADAPNDWKLVVVYRGKHCPICAKYLTELKEFTDKLAELKVDLVAVSADPVEKVEKQMAEIKPSYKIGYGLSIEQMRALGLYISDPRSPEETDRPFAEPGMFLINDKGTVQMVDISNAPFSRPDLESLVNGIEFIRSNDYPIRGTHQ
ncbi:peroxiredoxin-like family protein [Granulosicoccus sp. 3-233]|uniref:peroxiredoxin-like family protein n=1 Tax=Granulosicoccus sp. 3-233 TaxID=3417969 RepID=UPI003D349F93